VRIAVVTSAGPGWARAALEDLRVADLGLVVISAADTPAGKPDPTPYRLGAERIGVPPGRCVAAEDTPVGLAAARAAGVAHLIGMTTTRGAEELLAAGADTTASDLTALLP
jgi:sugar-phosphatase